jgi:hypothetical protein
VSQSLFIAAGIVSYAQNQKTAWSGDDDALVRWGHLESFSTVKTFSFADGRHTVQQVAEELSAEYGPVAVNLVHEYLEALKRIGVVE